MLWRPEQQIWRESILLGLIVAKQHENGWRAIFWLVDNKDKTFVKRKFHFCL